MKALIAAILVVCIVFTGGITYLNLDNRDAVIVEHAQALAAEQSTQEVPAAMEDVPAAEDEAAEVPETSEVAPVVTIDFENSSPLPSESVEQETTREVAFQ